MPKRRKKSKNCSGTSENGDIILYGKRSLKRRPASSNGDWWFWKLIRDNVETLDEIRILVRLYKGRINDAKKINDYETIKKWKRRIKILSQYYEMIKQDIQDEYYYEEILQE